MIDTQKSTSALGRAIHYLFKTPVGLIVTIVVGLFLLHSATTLALSATLYRDKTLPNLQINGVAMGNLTYSEARTKLQQQLSEQTVTVRFDDQEHVYHPTDMGIELDANKVDALLRSRRLVYFVIPWMVDDQRQVTLPLAFSEDAVEQVIVSLAEQAANIGPIDEVTTTYKSGRAPEITTVGQVGRSVNNTDAIVAGLLTSLEKPESYSADFSFDEIPFAKKTVEIDDSVRTITYDTVVWGSVQADFDEFLAQAAQTYADARGWSRSKISFRRVASGGNFTLVLAEPSRVEAAAPVCSATYSCRVGRYVIINDERWRTASPSWNAAGGSLRDYRHMVINHETGHWLGLGHLACPGAGQSAPVMLQQSISLQGCNFNPWPLNNEISSVD